MIARALLLALLLLPLSAFGEEEAEPALAPPPAISRIELLGAGEEDREQLRQLIRFEEGDPLSRRRLRRAIQRLYESGRFANVEAYAEELEEGVALSFVFEAKRLIREIEVEGATVARQEAVRATGLQAGMEYADDRLEHGAQGLRRALARAGYEAAQVEASAQARDGGVRLLYQVSPGAPTVVARRALVGEVGEEALVTSSLSLQEGDVFDRDRLEQDLEALRRRYREAGFYRAEVGAPQVRRLSDTEVAVEIPTSSGPRFAIRFEGNRIFNDQALRQTLAYQGQEPLDRALVADLAERLLRAYHLVGYPDARVLPLERLSPDEKKARLTFHVWEGLPLVVERISFRGNRSVPTITLRSWLAEEFAVFYPPRPLISSPRRGEVDQAAGKRGTHRPLRLEPEQIYEDRAYQSIVEGLVARYRDEGYLEATIEGPFVHVDEPTRLAQVDLRVHEGERTWIREVEYVGVESVSAQSLSSASVREGRPLSERLVDQHRLELQAHLARYGHLYAMVEVETLRDEADPTNATVRYKIHEGPKVRVGGILVQGNDRTRDWVVKESLGIDEGDVLSSDRIGGGQQGLMRLGLFRAASIRPIDPETPEEVKDLVVEVRERPAKSLEIGGGLSIADGPRAFTEYRDRNILGRNLQLVLRGRLNYQVFREEVQEMPFTDGLERDLQAGVRFPRIWGLGLPVGWHFDLTHERDIRLAYNLYRNSALTGFDFPLLSKLHGTLRFELESNAIDHSSRFDALYGPLSRTDLERLRFPDGDVLLGSIRPGFLLDLRNDLAYPTSGMWAKVEADFSRDLGGSTTVDFVKLSGTLTGYIPLTERTTLVLSGSGGKVFHLRGDSVAIPPKRFYLGGAGTMRGYAEDAVVPQDRRAALRTELADCQALIFRNGCTQQARFLDAGRAVPSEGGDLFVLARAELRFPLYAALMGGLFLDAGNLWIDVPQEIRPEDLRSAAGFGLRYATPVGPVALDLGFNLDPDRTIGEAPMAVHFSVGLF